MVRYSNRDFDWEMRKFHERWQYRANRIALVDAIRFTYKHDRTPPMWLIQAVTEICVGRASRRVWTDLIERYRVFARIEPDARRRYRCWKIVRALEETRDDVYRRQRATATHRRSR